MAFLKRKAIIFFNLTFVVTSVTVNEREKGEKTSDEKEATIFLQFHGEGSISVDLRRRGPGRVKDLNLWGEYISS